MKIKEYFLLHIRGWDTSKLVPQITTAMGLFLKTPQQENSSTLAQKAK